MRFTKREVIISASAFIAALAIVCGGLWWHGHLTHKKQLAEVAANTTGSSTMSLNQDDSGGGLSVSGQASDLGQLGAGNGNNAQSQNSSSNSGDSGDVDPSTFKQYDKYQSNKDALFGDILAGTGAQLGAGQKAGIYYKAWLTNGALIDQSPVSSSGQPQVFSFTMGAHQVIPGLEEGAYGMKAGGKRLVIVPPAVGYGSQGQGSVPPNAVLVFEVQLVSVQ